MNPRRHLVLFGVDTVHSSAFIDVFYFINYRRNPPATPAPATGNANATDGSSQNQADLVKSMTPEERKEYVTSFLKTQVCILYAQHVLFGWNYS